MYLLIWLSRETGAIIKAKRQENGSLIKGYIEDGNLI